LLILKILSVGKKVLSVIPEQILTGKNIKPVSKKVLSRGKNVLMGK